MTTPLDTPLNNPHKLRGAHRFPALLGLSYRKTMLSAATWSLCSSKQSKARLGQSCFFRINQSVCRVLVIEPTPSQVSNSLGRFTCTPPSFKKKKKTRRWVQNNKCGFDNPALIIYRSFSSNRAFYSFSKHRLRVIKTLTFLLNHFNGLLDCLASLIALSVEQAQYATGGKS